MSPDRRRRPRAPRFRKLGALAWALALLASAASARSPEELRSCLADNVPERSSALAVRLDSSHRGGATTRLDSRIYWRREAEGGSSGLICMSDPPSVRGLAYLVREEGAELAIWGYLPEKKRVLQIHPTSAARRAAIGRTALGYEDLRYLPMNLSAIEPGEVSTDTIDGREVRVVRLVPPPGGEPRYQRVLAFVDAETCVPLRTEFYGSGGKLVKRATAEVGSIDPEASIRFAASLRVEDLENERVTEMRVESRELDGELPERMFQPPWLERGRCP